MTIIIRFASKNIFKQSKHSMDTVSFDDKTPYSVPVRQWNSRSRLSGGHFNICEILRSSLFETDGHHITLRVDSADSVYKCSSTH